MLAMFMPLGFLLPFVTEKINKKNRTVDVYGMLLTENECDTVKSALANRFSEIDLYSNGKKIITANEYTVDAITVEEGILFTLHVVVDSVPYIDETCSIEKINLHTRQAQQFQKKSVNLA
jgi:hypothetical protein